MAGLVALLLVLAVIGTAIEAVKARSFGWAGLCLLAAAFALPAVKAVL